MWKASIFELFPLKIICKAFAACLGIFAAKANPLPEPAGIIPMFKSIPSKAAATWFMVPSPPQITTSVIFSFLIFSLR
jgi:hypothetical protein